MKSTQDKLKALFIEEAIEMLTAAEASVLRIRQGGCADEASKDALEVLFRLTHSLKGSAAGTGFGALSTLSRRVTRVLANIRKGVLAANPPVDQLILEGLGRIRELLHGLRADLAYQQDDADLIARLQKLAPDPEES